MPQVSLSWLPCRLLSLFKLEVLLLLHLLLGLKLLELSLKLLLRLLLLIELLLSGLLELLTLLLWLSSPRIKIIGTSLLLSKLRGCLLWLMKLLLSGNLLLLLELLLWGSLLWLLELLLLEVIEVIAILTPWYFLALFPLLLQLKLSSCFILPLSLCLLSPSFFLLGLEGLLFSE